MAKKPTFPEPGCWRCPHYTVQGKFPCETRYCMGTGRKRGKRFKKSDPQYKAPQMVPQTADAEDVPGVPTVRRT